MLFLLFLLVPMIEIYVLVQVGSAWGVLPTIGILILVAAVGVALMKQQWRLVWTQIMSDFQQQRVPADSLLQALLVFVAGLLMLTPGFVTDLLGMALLLPPVRSVVVVWLKASIQKRIAKGTLRVVHYHSSGPGPVVRDVTPPSVESLKNPKVDSPSSPKD